MKPSSIIIFVFTLLIFVSFVLRVNAVEPEKREKELLEKLKGNLDEEEILKNYYNLALVYIDYKKDESYVYVNKLKDFNNETAKLYWNLILSQLFFNEAKYDSAQLLLETAQTIFEKNYKDDIDIGESLYNSLGHLYAIQNMPDRAIEFYLMSISYSEMDMDYNSLCATCTNISYLYGYVGADNKIKLDYAYKALYYAEKSGDLYALEQAYSTLGNTLLSADSTQRGLEYQLKGLEISQQLKSENKECFAALNVACSYLDLEEFDKSEYYYKYALGIAKRIDLKRPQAYIYSCLSDVFREVKRFDLAKAYVDSALNIKDALSDREQLDVYVTALYLYVASCDLENFEETFDIFNELNDKAHDVEMHGKMAELDTKYETASKELKIEELKQQRKIMLIIGCSIALVAILLLMVLVFRQRAIKIKNKLTEQKVKQIEQEKKLEITQAVLDGESAERGRLARDLHDGLGGMLSVVKLNLRDIQNGAAIEGNEVIRFNKAIEMLDDSIGELRRVAHHIMPRSLMEYGLKASLSDFCSEIKIVKFHHFGTETRFDSKLEILIYRAAHELVNNALKYANASTINVQLVQEYERISLTVQDDGIGFDTSQKYTGMGLENIRNRVEVFNGTLSIYSAKDSGSEINIEFNIRNNDKSSDC